MNALPESSTDSPPSNSLKVRAGGIAGKDLLSIIERIERLEEEKSGIGEDIGLIYSEAKGKGFDAKIIRMIVRRRKREHHELDEEQTLLDLYLSAIGSAVEP